MITNLLQETPFDRIRNEFYDRNDELAEKLGPYMGGVKACQTWAENDDRDVTSRFNWQLHTRFSSWRFSQNREPAGQAGTNCGLSSPADVIQNFVLKARMLKFLRHLRLKCHKLIFLRPLLVPQVSF